MQNQDKLDVIVCTAGMMGRGSMLGNSMGVAVRCVPIAVAGKGHQRSKLGGE